MSWKKGIFKAHGILTPGVDFESHLQLAIFLPPIHLVTLQAPPPLPQAPQQPDPFPDFSLPPNRIWSCFTWPFSPTRCDSLNIYGGIALCQVIIKY